MTLDHTITPAHTFADTPVARWDANVRAIKIVKQLEAEGRQATPEEQAAMAQYAGFGDSAFDPGFRYEANSRDSEAWQRRRKEIIELLTPEELESIRTSRLTAFYTTTGVVNAVWDGLERMGVGQLDNPRILEPSAGSGRFLGLQPPEMAARSDRTAVELDELTAALLKHTYPQTRVYQAGFQDAPTQDDYYDVAISNIPFGQITIRDPDFTKSGRRFLTRQIHNYFFAKALDKVRPGGVVAFVTTHGMMDSPKNEAVRRYLADRADLVGAIRLPKDAFPDTEVVTDIVFLRKRAPGGAPGDDSWVKSEPKPLGGYDWRRLHRRRYNVNRYYQDNPDQVLGKESEAGSMYRGDGEYTVESDPERPIDTALPHAIRTVTAAGVIGERPIEAEQRPVTPAPLVAEPVMPAKYVADDGKLKVEHAGKVTDPKLSKKDSERILSLVQMRDAARQLVDLEASGADSDAMNKTRTELKGLYDAHIAKFKEPVNTPANRKMMRGDADDHLLFALEVHDERDKSWKPAVILERRAVGSVTPMEASTASDALQVVLNATGRPDFTRMGNLLKRGADDVREELARDGLIFRSADGLSWIPRAEYLSGDVRQKLKQAKIAATLDPDYELNVRELEKVLPEKVSADDIAVPLGASWIPPAVVNSFVDETFTPYNRGEQFFRYAEDVETLVGKSSKGIGGWRASARIGASKAILESQWGTKKMPAGDILRKLLRGEPIVVMTKDAQGASAVDTEETEAAKTKAKELQSAFEEWLWRDPERREFLERAYNDAHNALAPRVFDGTHQTFPGMTLEWRDKLKPHQRDGIYRVVNDGTALLAHEVGFGKTATMVGSAIERKRMGFANKPVFVVPKATHEQFVRQFLELYPGARILAPDNKSFQKNRREQFLARIATGDWDGVVLSSEQFQSIPLSAETEKKWADAQLAELRAALLETDDRQTQNMIQNRIVNFSTRIEELVEDMKEGRDNTLTFEKLGIDQLYVDEADRYKNLPFTTNMGRVKGLPQSQSKRAWDMYMKVRWLQDKMGEKPDGQFAKGGVVFATGTPIANTIAEVWTMMRYLQPRELERRGVAHFDAWAKTFGRTETSVEQTVAGTHRLAERFSAFENLAGLSALFQNVADIRVAAEVPEMLKVQPRLVDDAGEPDKRTTIVSPPYPEFERYMEEIVDRAENIDYANLEKDNMLKIASDARKASLDLRMVDPAAPKNPEGKIALAAQNIARIYREETPLKGTQLVFLDLGTPKAGSGKDDEREGASEETGAERDLLTNVYAALRSDLVAAGVPREQIAFIHDYKTAKQREDLFAAVREGNVRVLIGSTEKIGVGVNVQDRAAAAHHLDVPWRPRDLEQREGRIIRQGNEVYGPKLSPDGEVLSPGRGVRIYQYVQEPGFDGFMWQAVEKKARSVRKLMRRKHEGQTLEDADPFVIGAAEAKALATGNPLILRAVELEQKIAEGRASRRGMARQRERAMEEKKMLEGNLAAWQAAVPLMERDAAYLRQLPAKQDFAAVVGRKEYDKRSDAAKALEQTVKGMVRTMDMRYPTPIGRYKGFDVGALHSDRGYKLVVTRPETGQPYTSAEWVDEADVSGLGLFARLDNLLKGVSGRAERLKDSIAEAETSLPIYESQMAKRFDGAPELEHAERQLRVIQYTLSKGDSKLQSGDDPEMDVMSAWQAAVKAAPGAEPSETLHRGNAPMTTTMTDFASRYVDAEQDAWDSLVESIKSFGEITTEEAEQVANFYIAEKIVKLDHSARRYAITHGAVFDSDTIKRALETAKRTASSQPSPSTGEGTVQAKRDESPPVPAPAPAPRSSPELDNKRAALAGLVEMIGQTENPQLREALEWQRDNFERDIVRMEEALPGSGQEPSATLPKREYELEPEVVKASADQVERIQAMATIEGGKLAGRMAAGAKSLGFIEARSLIDELSGLIEESDERKRAALNSLNMGHEWRGELTRTTEPQPIAPAAPPAPREIPDVDSLTMQTAAQAAVADPEDADTPQEVAEVLEDELVEGRTAAGKSPSARDAGEAVDKASTPTTRGTAADAGSLAEDVLRLDAEPEDETKRKQPPPEDEDHPTEERPAPKLAASPDEPDPATPDQVERVRALAAIDGGQDARRLADSIERMSAQEADDAIAELTLRIEVSGDPNKLSKLHALDVAAIATDDAPPPDAKATASQTDQDRLIARALPLLAADKAYQNAIANSDEQNARIEHDAALKSGVAGLMGDHTDLYKRYADEPAFARAVAGETFSKSYRPRVMAATPAAAEDLKQPVERVEEEEPTPKKRQAPKQPVERVEEEEPTPKKRQAPKQPVERVEEEEPTPKKRQAPKPTTAPIVVDDEKPKARKEAKRIPASKIVLEGVPFYQGHKGLGIGYLQADLPDRRDADKDTVVGERRAKKDAKYKLSPLKLLASVASKPLRRRKSIPGVKERKL